MSAPSAIINEETDPYQVIKRLKTEVAALKSEVAFLKGEAVRTELHAAPCMPPPIADLMQGDAELSEQDRLDLDASVEAWLREGPEATLSIGSLTLNRINYTFQAIRRFAVAFGGGGEAAATVPHAQGSAGGGGGGGSVAGNNQQISTEVVEVWSVALR